MPSVQTTAPTISPISVAEAKQHLRVDHDSDNNYISSLIKVATASAENYLRRGIMQQTRRWDGCEFPSGGWVLDLPPLVSVSSLDYTATDGSTVTVGSSVYEVDTTSVPGRVYLGKDQTWPTPIESLHDAVRLSFVTGHATSSSAVPVEYKHAIKLMVERWYEHRGEVASGSLKQMPHGVEALLTPTRNMRFV